DPAGGAFWVAYDGDKVSKFTYDGDYNINTTPAITISRLDNPAGLAIADLDEEDYHLFITETGTNDRIRQVPLDGLSSDHIDNAADGSFAEFGQNYKPGPVQNNAYRWDNNAPIAVEPGGVVTVTDGN